MDSLPEWWIEIGKDQKSETSFSTGMIQQPQACLSCAELTLQVKAGLFFFLLLWDSRVFLKKNNDEKIIVCQYKVKIFKTNLNESGTQIKEALCQFHNELDGILCTAIWDFGDTFYGQFCKFNFCQKY